MFKMSRSKSRFGQNLEEFGTQENFLNSCQTPLSAASTRTRETFKAAFFNFMRDFKKKHKDKNYKYVIRLGSRRWKTMTQAARAPYVLEAAKNRLVDKPKTKRDAARKHPVKKKQDGKQKKAKKNQCPSCGRNKNSRGGSSTSGSDSHSSKSSKSSKSSRSKKTK